MIRLALNLALQCDYISMNWILGGHEGEEGPRQLVVILQQTVHGVHHGLLLDVHVVGILLATL